MLRKFFVGLILGSLVLLAGCTSPAPHSYTLVGRPIIGEIVRVEPAVIWQGDVEADGHIFWLRSIGPSEKLIVFSSYRACPIPRPSKARYLVMLGYERLGYQVDEAIKNELTGLTATSCTLVDPTDSHFTNWHER